MLISILLIYLAACAVGAVLLFMGGNLMNKGHGIENGLAAMALMGLGIIPFYPWLKLYVWIDEMREVKE